MGKSSTTTPRAVKGNKKGEKKPKLVQLLAAKTILQRLWQMQRPSLKQYLLSKSVLEKAKQLESLPVICSIKKKIAKYLFPTHTYPQPTREGERWHLHFQVLNKSVASSLLAVKLRFKTPGNAPRLSMSHGASKKSSRVY